MSLVIATGVGLLLVAAVLALTSFSLSQVAYYSVGAFVFLISWNGIRLAGHSFSSALFILAAVSSLFYAMVNRRRIALPPWLVGFAALLLASALVNAIWPPNPALVDDSALQYLQEYAVIGYHPTVYYPGRSNVSALLTWEIAVLMIPPILVAVAESRARINRLLDLWVLGATVNAVVGVLDVGGFHFLAAQPLTGHRSAGLTVHPNYLSLTCLLTLPLAARMIRTTPRRTIVGVVALVAMLGGEYASGSRDGEAVTVLVLVLCLVAFPRIRFLLRYAVPAAAVALAVLLFVPGVEHSVASQLRLTGGASTGVTGSDYQRQIFAHVADVQISARPVSGIGMAADNDAQNIYLQILASGGVIALIGFALLVGGVLVSVRRLLPTRLSAEATAIGIAVAGWAINGYFDAQIADKYLYVLPGILIACAHVARSERRQALAPGHVPLSAGRAPQTEQPGLLPAPA